MIDKDNTTIIEGERLDATLELAIAVTREGREGRRIGILVSPAMPTPFSRPRRH